MTYADRTEDLIQDTKVFLKSEFGAYVMETLSEMQKGFLSQASDMSNEHPDRYLAKYNALQEVLELIRQPLDDDTPLHG